SILADIGLYRRLVAMQVRAQAQYKANLVIDISTYFVITGFELLAVMLLFGPFPSILGWKIGEVAMLYALTSLGFGLAELFGAVIFVAILLLGATLCFWTVESTELTNILTYGGREMLSYPLSIYNQGLQRFFLYVVPLAFCSYIPACYLLGRPLPFGLPAGFAFAAPLVALAFALLAGAAWRFGVQHYQSTGS